MRSKIKLLLPVIMLTSTTCCFSENYISRMDKNHDDDFSHQIYGNGINRRVYKDYSGYMKVFIDGDVGGGGGSYNPNVTSYDIDKILSNNYKDLGCIRKNCGVGVHLYCKYKSYQVFDDAFVQQFTDFYDVENLNVTFSEFVESTSSLSISFQHNYSYEIACKMSKAANVNIPGADFTRKDEKTAKSVYSYDENITYSVCMSKSRKVTYEFTDNAKEQAKALKKSSTDMAKLAAGRRAQVYKIETLTYEANDFWWNHNDKIKDSEKSSYSYVIVNPYVTTIFANDVFYTKL